MIFILAIFLFAVSYHAFSYGLHLIKKEKNFLAAIGVISMAVINLAAPILLFIIKY